MDGINCKEPRALARHRQEDVTLEAEPLLRMLGYRDMSSVRKVVRQVADKAATDAQSRLAPVAAYRRFAVSALDESSLTLDGGARFQSAQFQPVLKDCTEVLVFVLTIGEAVDAESLRLIQAEEIVEALFLETAGWLAVERATRSFVKHLNTTLAPDGMRLTRRRLAPGYFDWGLEEQPDFFALFGQAELPVQLSPNCVMLPKKSRSGLYGLTAREK